MKGGGDGRALTKRLQMMFSTDTGSTLVVGRHEVIACEQAGEAVGRSSSPARDVTLARGSPASPGHSAGSKRGIHQQILARLQTGMFCCSSGKVRRRPNGVAQCPQCPTHETGGSLMPVIAEETQRTGFLAISPSPLTFSPVTSPIAITRAPAQFAIHRE